MDRRSEDRFLRFLLDASPDPLEYGAYKATARFRGLTERYDRYASESRYQGELTAGVSRRLVRESSLWISGRVEGRSYPDSLLRDFHERRAAFGFGSPFRGGRINISGNVEQIDYREFDRRTESIVADYQRRIHPRADLRFLTEFEWSRYSRMAWKIEEKVLITEGKQRDRSREARLELRYLRRWLFELTASWVSVRSNSFGFSVGRRSFELGVSGWLPGSVLCQLRGKLQSFSYHDAGLDEYFIAREGENLEAVDDNNRFLLRMKRRLGRHVAVEGRFSWFRNETLLAGDFYRKGLATVGLVFSPMGDSEF